MPIDEGELVASWRRVEHPLYNALYRMLWDAQECQDMIQDAYLRLWSRRTRVDADRIDALAWTAALNLARNRLRWRRLRGWPVAPDTLDGIAGGEDPQAAAEQAGLHAALRRLPVAMLEVVLMAEFSGMSTRGIAQALGIPEGTVASRKHKAVQRLKQWLGDQ
ncbi:sigma-70 family RNA polymerase sigma factor [Luteimonas sp. MJ293]|uniref:RNA polymerase sigma factor n=1 Tax=Luteimonas sp. MJ146 TaxID=3129240 RepID=UPI0031BB6AF7